MFCSKCGAQIKDSDKFCPACGAKLGVDAKDGKPAKCWTVFAKVSKILGIVSVSVCWIPLMFGLVTGVPGIVFSILGNHSIEPEAINNRKTGRILSIVGSSVSFAIYIATIVTLIIVLD